jgi:phytoene dehydrogenase-like protein
MSERIENQVERFAPGFRATILARNVRGTADLQRDNANLVGGDIGGGAQTMHQLLFRHAGSAYRVPLAGVYLCSSSLAPGPGVHGMCGYNAAQRALADRRLHSADADVTGDIGNRGRDGNDSK